MLDGHREHKRIDRIFTLLYCIADEYPQKWDMSVIENISTGGILFIAPIDVDLNGKNLLLKIKIPELAPHSLDLTAVVLGVKPRFNGKSADVRAKFIDLTELDKEHLTIVETIIKKQEDKKAS